MGLFKDREPEVVLKDNGYKATIDYNNSLLNKLNLCKLESDEARQKEEAKRIVQGYESLNVS